MAKKLELRFVNSEDKVVTIALEAPIEPVDPLQVEQAMDEILAQNVFTSSGGDLVGKRGARIVERNVTDIEF
ncbi:DUF2922 domain-containing protein [Salirhabdus sp. Marseille-P4669]|uniref:DUF2922 domain-containing protein n=1 Tax=Salirhabdus sp. Marseille-P4669 TaxID=2042310 RepID=UPI000C79ADB9|nr:DUF2922 domain-containing protein [Salirhabdus sp. Marseille-P4669]